MPAGELTDRDVVRAVRSSAAGDGYVTGEQVLDALRVPDGDRPVRWRRLVELADPTLRWFPPLEGRGNLGHRRDDDPPADPPYVELRVGLAGYAGLADPAHPLHLVNGDLHDGGTRPPFHPARVAAALRALLAPGPGPVGLTDVLGMPSFPVGCAVDGDHAALIAGEPATLDLRAVVASAPGDGRGRALTVSGLPPRTRTARFDELLYEHIRTDRRLIADYRDVTVESDHVSRWSLAAGADEQQARDFVLGLPGLHERIPAALDRPAAVILGRWLGTVTPAWAHRVAADLGSALRPTGVYAHHQRWDQPPATG